ncbi:radical SAM protein [Tissierella creatinini]|nr:radical SAM protein [Tissierella creatinini]TJX63807.1 radical SAM protein [Soehngenia saccharolytica]
MKKLPLFKKVYIEITNLCNLKCEFCPTTNRSPRFMIIEEFMKILDEVKSYTGHIYLHIKGEPLMHPNIGEFLDIANENGLHVNLTTNGTFIANCREVLLNKPSLRQINISLHSLDQNQWYLNQEDYMDNILDFIEEAKDNKIIVALRLWNLSSQKDDNLQKNGYILNRLKEIFNLNFSLIEEFKTKRGIKLSERLYLNEDMEFIWPSLENDIYEEKGFCYGLRDQLGILVDGTVVPCCLDGDGIISLGNIHKTSLEEILNSQRALDIYNGFSNRNAVEDLCKKCGYRSKFGG